MVEAPDWTPWGEPRLAERGVETAWHHEWVMLRRRGEAEARIAAPGDVVFGGEPGALEWSPMPWAMHVRRYWRAFETLSPATVFRGRDDRLFHFSNNVCEQLFEGGALGPRGLEGWTSALARRLDFCEARGIVYRHLVIPEGHAVYADAIPGAPKLSDERPLMQILRAGGERLSNCLVYPLEAMIAGRAKAETSQPHDVHFTGWGGYLCYRELMASLPGVDPASLVREQDLSVRNVFIAGDVARGAGEPGRRVDFHDAPHPKFKAIVKGTSFVTHQVDVMESEFPHLPRLVIFRTSNTTHLFPYLMRHFSRLVAVASVSFFYDLIESEKPDVVIAEGPERYLAPHRGSFNETDCGGRPDDPEQEFEVRTGHKLPLPRCEG